MTLCQLVKAIDDFNGKFSIGGVGDVFFLYGGVNQYARLLGLKATLILKIRLKPSTPIRFLKCTNSVALQGIPGI
jgi:hypothetical protein